MDKEVHGSLECTLVKKGPVVDTAHQATNMDVIEIIIGERPLQLCIIDLESEIRWNPLINRIN